MKTITLILLVVPLWVSSSLAQYTNITGLLYKEETRTEIFNVILNDHNLMLKFIDAMKHNDHAMMMMNENYSMSVNPSSMGNSPMMNHSSIMGNEHMDEAQTSGGHHMNSMANSNEMMNQMVGIMKENPQMMPEIMGRMMNPNGSQISKVQHMPHN